MLLDRPLSWRQRRWPQPVNEAQDLSEQRSWDGDLRELKGDVTSVANHLRTDLDQLLPQCGERPVLDFLRQRQCLLRVMCGRLPVRKVCFEVCASWSGAVMCPAC